MKRPNKNQMRIINNKITYLLEVYEEKTFMDITKKEQLDEVLVHQESGKLFVFYDGNQLGVFEVM